jgi:hypothetical protein
VLPFHSREKDTEMYTWSNEMVQIHQGLYMASLVALAMVAILLSSYWAGLLLAFAKDRAAHFGAPVCYLLALIPTKQS